MPEPLKPPTSPQSRNRRPKPNDPFAGLGQVLVLAAEADNRAAAQGALELEVPPRVQALFSYQLLRALRRQLCQDLAVFVKWWLGSTRRSGLCTRASHKVKTAKCFGRTQQLRPAGPETPRCYQVRNMNLGHLKTQVCFRVYRAWGFGFCVWGLGFRVWGLGIWV